MTEENQRVSCKVLVLLLLAFLTERNCYIPEDSWSDVLDTSPARNKFTEFLRVNLKWGNLSHGIPASSSYS
jgi:hypothetical protein